MPLRMLGDVRQQADHGSRQALAPDIAGLGEGCWVDAAYDVFGFPQRLIEVSEQLLAIHTRVVLALNGRQLLRRERPLLKVRQETFRATCNMANVEAGRSEAVRARPKLIGRQARGVTREIFARLLKGVEHRRG